MRIVSATIVSMALMTSICTAQSPTTAPAAAGAARAADKPYTLTELGVREMKATNFVYRSIQTTLPEMKTVIEAPLMELEAALTKAGVAATGMPIFVYRGASPDPAQKFTLEVGLPVPDNAEAPEGFESRHIGGDRAFTVIVVGPMSQMMAAYGELFGALFTAGHTPTETLRERYLHWESDDSPNNVIQIEVVLQD